MRLLVPLLLCACLCAVEDPPAVPPVVRWSGTGWVDAAGRATTLDGVNLGNWLLIEPWMFGIRQVPDQHTLITTLQRRLGAAAVERLLTLHRETWIGERDVALIASFGWNTVRLPFDYRLVLDETGTVRADAFHWLDLAVARCRTAGLRIILDLHSAPGGQFDNPSTGRQGENRLWSDDEAQRRTALVWSLVARRYRSEPQVVAYDLLNEPYGHGRDAAGQAVFARVIDLLGRSVRNEDPLRVIFAPGGRDDLRPYGDALPSHWTLTGFTEHFYPGLFGEAATLESHARHLGLLVPARARHLAAFGVPYLVGEYNAVRADCGAAPMTRMLHDAYMQHGWAATLWSWKMIGARGGPQEWSAVANAEPLPPPDLDSIDEAGMAAWLRAAGSGAQVVHEAMRRAMTSDHPPRYRLRPFVLAPDPPPAATPPADWSLEAIGGARGGLQLSADGLTMWAGGGDIWSQSDDFRFLHRSATEEADWSAALTISSLADTHEHAKAGLMLRAGLAPDAPFIMAMAKPEDTVGLSWRSSRGAPVREQLLHALRWPVEFRLVQQDRTVTAWCRSASSAWIRLGAQPWAASPDDRLGIALCAHHPELLTSARCSLPDIRPGAVEDPEPVAAIPPANLLRDAAERWATWGDGWRSDALGLQRGVAHGHAGAWQDVSVAPGIRHRFAVEVQVDAAASGQLGLRLEAPYDPPIHLARRTIDLATLPPGVWVPLQISGTAASDRLRTVILVEPGTVPSSAVLRWRQARLEADSD